MSLLRLLQATTPPRTLTPPHTVLLPASICISSFSKVHVGGEKGAGLNYGRRSSTVTMPTNQQKETILLLIELLK